MFTHITTISSFFILSRNFYLIPFSFSWKSFLQHLLKSGGLQAMNSLSFLLYEMSLFLLLYSNFCQIQNYDTRFSSPLNMFTTNLLAQNHIKILSHNSGSQKSKTDLSWQKSRCQQACVPSGGSKGKSASQFLQLLEIANFQTHGPTIKASSVRLTLYHCHFCCTFFPISFFHF